MVNKFNVNHNNKINIIFKKGKYLFFWYCFFNKLCYDGLIKGVLK